MGRLRHPRVRAHLFTVSGVATDLGGGARGRRRRRAARTANKPQELAFTDGSLDTCAYPISFAKTRNSAVFGDPLLDTRT